MLSAEEQLRHIEGLLLRTGGTLGRSSMLVDPADADLVGILDATLTYPHGHRLDVTLTVDVTPGYPHWVHYSFQLLDADDRCVFRYDNAPHHRRLVTFPHHKHVGLAETAQAHHLPTLHDIVDEVIRETSTPATNAT